ncbi:acetyl-CoA carboxylase biotin carboxyl carrier protein [Acetobacter persici]|uniref:acetyl-CoA carboxylase biotin carboxyl carrier protein n=1 Tax=Acetobacter persici TaxID=1076596 RepID=UPI0007E5D121|nr:acetyl-CoA carboxylase biotin carboxyl carrier protein [Acetobacter persici]MBS0961815.1 acetyl-CoA carboxylase biotin carboxyl carrier protein [Acetobacter persici]MCG0999406.1 acetyl-CoA carboxylase biotin carboxyl carrier protein [Acetobacter persici]
MDTQALKALIDLFGRAPLHELEISEGGQTLKITRSEQGAAYAAPAPARPLASAEPSAGPATSAPAPAAPTHAERVVTAPMYGTLHLSPSPDAPPFVAVGDTVSVGQQIGLIEAMKVFTPIKTEVSGRVEAILVTDDSEVEADQPLMRLS